MVKKDKNWIWIILIVGAILVYGGNFIGAIVTPSESICSSPTSCTALPQFIGCSWTSSGGITYIDCGCASGYVPSGTGVAGGAANCILSDGDGDGGGVIVCTEGRLKCNNGLLYECFAGDWDYYGRCEYENNFKSGVCKVTNTERETIGELCVESNGVDGDGDDVVQCEGHNKGEEWCDGDINKFCSSATGTVFSTNCKSLLGQYGVCKTSTDTFGNIVATCETEGEPECQEGTERNYQCINYLSKWEKCENGKWIGKDTLCSNIPDGFCDSSTGKCDYSESGWCKISNTQCLQITNCKSFNIHPTKEKCESMIYLEERWCYDSNKNDCVLKTTTTTEKNCFSSDEKSKCEENIVIINGDGNGIIKKCEFYQEFDTEEQKCKTAKWALYIMIFFGILIGIKIIKSLKSEK